jgi:hypothetical protein
MAKFPVLLITTVDQADGIASVTKVLLAAKLYAKNLAIEAQDGRKLEVKMPYTKPN